MCTFPRPTRQFKIGYKAVHSVKHFQHMDTFILNRRFGQMLNFLLSPPLPPLGTAVSDRSSWGVKGQLYPTRSRYTDKFLRGEVGRGKNSNGERNCGWEYRGSPFQTISQIFASRGKRTSNCTPGRCFTHSVYV